MTVDKAAAFWAWFTDWPLRVLLILLVGTVVLIVVRRTVGHVAERIAQGYHRAYADVAEAGSGETEPAGGTAKTRRRSGAVLVEDTLGLVSPEVKQRRAQRARTVGSVLSSAANVVIGAAMVLFILGALGQGAVVQGLLASAGVVGVAVGFGAQSLVRDFLSGIFILIEDQFGVGDEVDLGGGAAGVVERVDLRLTHVRSFDGTLWHVRNGEILRAGNHTQQWARAVAKVSVPVGADVDTVRAALGRAVDVVSADPAMSAALIEVPSVRGVDALTDGSYSFTLHGRVRPGTDGDVARALLVQAQLELLRAGVIESTPSEE
ncbi:mechanosensitive ion channel family protein [Xylanimonas allomyrinae]|uniref:Mechanosensitive ion channel family protein n=2 Tax=Xylanimonas allomyrinae TaxID=2509459 RepID=A0A4P6EP57_9MICO|nr:mechanosensitive ion channel family protein [Xylanimonas allomyrinae]